jgi:hypothetical protein
LIPDVPTGLFSDCKRHPQGGRSAAFGIRNKNRYKTDAEYNKKYYERVKYLEGVCASSISSLKGMVSVREKAKGKSWGRAIGKKNRPG